MQSYLKVDFRLHRTSFTILTVQKLGQSTLLVKVDFKGLTSAVAFVDFFKSMMAFTHKLTFRAAWLMSAAAFKAIKYTKKRPKSSQQLRKFFNYVIV